MGLLGWKADFFEGLKNGMTPEGGFVIKLTNRTGATSVKGTIVMADTVNDNAVKVATSGTDMPVGIIYNSGVADGSEVWVVVSGIAEVLLKDATASTRGYWVGVSNVAGRADATNANPNPVAHFTEIGHCLESKNAGTNVLAKCIIHFN